MSLLQLASCSEERRTSVKDYPVNTPFIYSNKVLVNGVSSKDEKKRLTLELDNYWDDSLKARKEQRVLFWYRIKNPPVFDSVNLSRSRNYMNAYLNSQGYYYSNIKDSTSIDSVGDQFRVHALMNVTTGKNITIDSVDYQLEDSTLQTITNQRMKGRLLKKGDHYSKQIVNEELDRLIKIYRNNGYYKFTKEDIYAEVDSSDISLMNITLNPFKQAELIAATTRKRLENPQWDISFKKRTTYDSSKLTQYSVGHIYYYPETKLSDVTDSLPLDKSFTEENYGNVWMRHKQGKFKYSPLKEHTFFAHGEIYNEELYFKSLNTLGQVGAWQQVDGKIVPRDKDTLDFYFFLTPTLKQNFTVDLEGSRNTGDIGSGNLFGISTNLSYRNRNVWKQAIQSVTNFRTGVELNLNLGNSNSASDQLVQTFNISAGETFAFPRLIQPFNRWKGLRTLDNKRTLLSIQASYVDRKNYYKLRSIVGSWGYEWKKVYRRAENTWLFKPFNVELYSLDTLPGLDTLFMKNPFLRNSFNTGNIFSQSLSFVRTYTSANRNNHYIRLGLEETGLLFGAFNKLKDNIYRYIKLEAEYKQTKKYQKSVMAYRAFAGFGYNYGSYPGTSASTLPFFKQFSLGGPYSMRAWGLRQLGLGGSNTYDSISTSSFRDRYGDMALEGNIEYRFNIATVAGVKIGSALYSDIGNIWNVKKNPNDPNSVFSLSNFGKELAIGVGTGVRVDFTYFMIRLDFAYKVKDPVRMGNNGWMSINKFNWTDVRPNGLEVPNFALQLGIGLPF
ncbi:MAG: BamA/TamA family outer membrane protein [Bacteroidota bacterium]